MLCKFIIILLLTAASCQDAQNNEDLSTIFDRVIRIANTQDQGILSRAKYIAGFVVGLKDEESIPKLTPSKSRFPQLTNDFATKSPPRWPDEEKEKEGFPTPESSNPLFPPTLPPSPLRWPLQTDKPSRELTTRSPGLQTRFPDPELEQEMPNSWGLVDQTEPPKPPGLVTETPVETTTEPPRSPTTVGKRGSETSGSHDGFLMKPAQGRPDTNNAGPEDLPCTTPDGRAGQCVFLFTCKNGTIVTDGSQIIYKRTQIYNRITRQVSRIIKQEDSSRDGDASCPSFLHTCCALPVTSESQTLREGCGWRNPEGVGNFTKRNLKGKAKFGEFPWMIGILRTEPVDALKPDGLSLFVFVGGGSLIHPSVVLTAAQLVENTTLTNLRVRAGEWNTLTEKEPYPLQNRKVNSYEIHQDFNRGNLFHDIAVLFLAKPMKLAPNVGVVCLPPPRKPVPSGTRCFATGWGKDKLSTKSHYQDILKKVELPVVDRETCQTELRKTKLDRFFKLHSSFMCAGGEPGMDVCIGDGGSPLSCPIEMENERYLQSGIVSWGIDCGDAVPGVYVDVSYMRTWIDAKVTAKGYDPMTYTY